LIQQDKKMRLEMTRNKV